MTKEEIQVVRRKHKEVEEYQQMLAQVAKESISIVNIASLDLAKHMDNINKRVTLIKRHGHV